MADFRVTLAVCAHRDVKVRAWATMWNLANCPNPKISPLIQEGDALISRSRNKVATHFLKNLEDEYLMFLDDDVEISSLDATQMMWDMHKNNYPILGAAYALKNPDKSGFAIYPIQGSGTFQFGKSGSIIPVKRVSTGCMIVRREVLIKLVKKESVHFCENSGNYSFFQHRDEMIDGKWDELSEDWFFCNEAIKLGYQIFLDTRPKLNHYGQFPYNWDFVMLNGQFKKHDDINLSYNLEK